MATREDIEHYLLKLGHAHETLADNMWVIRDQESTKQSSSRTGISA
jgi:hypothetical protein